MNPNAQRVATLAFCLTAGCMPPGQWQNQPASYEQQGAAPDPVESQPGLAPAQSAATASTHGATPTAVGSRSGPQSEQPPAAASRRKLAINGRPATAEDLHTLASLETRAGRRIPDGRYWYDRVSGAAGHWGGPMQWLLPPNLPLGGPLPAHASGGGTGVFVNGREIHPADAARLHQLTGVRPIPGRWWVDARGDYGREGGPPLGNLNAMARQRGQGRSWSMRWADGEMNMAGDGDTTCVNTAEYTRCY